MFHVRCNNEFRLENVFFLHRKCSKSSAATYAFLRTWNSTKRFSLGNDLFSGRFDPSILENNNVSWRGFFFNGQQNDGRAGVALTKNKHYTLFKSPMKQSQLNFQLCSDVKNMIKK